MIYQYECEKCGVYDYSQRMSEEAFTVCPHCGGVTRRIITGGTGVIFKGTGFYQTDYKRKNVRDPSVTKEEKLERRDRAKKVIRDHAVKTERKFI